MNKHLAIAAVEPAEQPLVFVECVWIDKLYPAIQELYYPERDSCRCNLKDVIADIRSGELENVHQVYEVGRVLPITEDVCRDIMELELSEHGSIRESLEPLLMKHLGAHAMLNAEVQDRMARMA